jgi:UDP-N-acetylmuramyl pentapeptide phosphotransferase/UDP-N-acetylglucosamine-1-phosphate transferase
MDATNSLGFLPVLALAAGFLAAAISAGLIVALRPVLVRYALARPNARSSHREPTPQGAGIAVIAATIATIALCSPWIGVVDPAEMAQLRSVLAATIFVAVVGAIDDIRTLTVLPRLILQALAVAAVVAALPLDLRIVPLLPWWIERGLLLVAGIWFVNLVNFMDGIDWMTVAEVVPLTAGLVVLGTLGALPVYGTIAALALLGALIGFAPFNRPVAKLFLGDVGSLAIGLLVGWLLVLVAGRGQVVAALLLPLYYLADTGITLLRRLIERQPVWQAHRTHFYQRATDNGFTVTSVVARVFAVNVALAVLAIATVLVETRAARVSALVLGAVLVAGLLTGFSRQRR